MRIFILGFCTLLCIVRGLSQGALRQEAYRFLESEMPKQANIGQGLSMLMEDSLGQVWAHNNVHLLRLGMERTQIFATSGTTQLPGYIVRLLIDIRRHLWVSTSNGLYRLDPLTQKLESHPIILNGQEMKGPAVAAFGPYLLLSYGKGELIRYHPATRKVTVLQTGINHGFISCIKRSSNNHLFFTDRQHLYQLLDSVHIKRITSLPAGYMGMQLEETADGKWLYLCFVNGQMAKIRLADGLIQLLQNNAATGLANSFDRIHWQHKDYLLAAGNHGIAWLDPQTDETQVWENNALQKGVQLSGYCGGALQDRAGNIWMGNNEKCLLLPAATGNAIPYFLYDASAAIWPANQDAGPEAIAFDATAKALVFGVADSIAFFNTDQQKLVEKITLPPGSQTNDLAQLSPGVWLAASNNGLYKIAAGKAEIFSEALGEVAVLRLLVKGDTVFAGTYAQGMYELLSNGKVLAHYDKSSGTAGNYFPAFCLDKWGRVWMSNGKSTLYMRQGRELIKVPYDGSAISLAFVYDLVTDIADSSKLWLAGQGGLLSFNVATNKVGDLTPSAPNGFDLNLWRIQQRGNGRMLLSSSSNRLYEWDSKTGAAIPLGVVAGWWAENLPSAARLCFDDKGNCWSSFRYGLVNLGNKSFLESTTIHPPQLQALEIGYQRWQAHPAMYHAAPMVLSYKQSPLSVVCAGNQDGLVQFKLEGYDAQWQTGERATYSNLNAGNYVFKARLLSPAGFPSEEQHMQLTILPPWWKTLWFRLLAIAGIFALSWFFIKRRIGQLNKENSYQLMLAQSELKAIRSQMNPHFIFNCITAIDGLIAKNEKAKASAYLGKFSKLLRQVLQQSTRQFVPLDDDLDTLALYLELEQWRMDGGFEWEINAAPALRQSLELPPLLLQPFVENAIIHGLKPKAGTDKKLQISASQTAGSIRFEITDNGVGRAASASGQNQLAGHKSLGTQLTQDRLQLLEKVLGYTTLIQMDDLTNEAGAACGTRVIILLQTPKNIA